MKHLIFFLLLAFAANSQVREQEPLPYTTKKPVSELSKGVKGWCKTPDGQWVSDDQRIPVKVISRNDDARKEKINRPGIDNFEEFQLYPVLYERDTLIMLVKVFEVGQYRFEKTRKNWKDQKNAYYYIFEKKELKPLRNFNSEKTELITIPLLYGGSVQDVRPGNAIKYIKKKLMIPSTYDHQLILTARTYEFQDSEPREEVSPERIQFQIHSTHQTAKEVKGVVQDFQVLGKSLYGSKKLLDHIYYECDKRLFANFFSYDPEEVKYVMK